jgi:hypothetical protein
VRVEFDELMADVRRFEETLSLAVADVADDLREFDPSRFHRDTFYVRCKNIIDAVKAKEAAGLAAFL